MVGATGEMADLQTALSIVEQENERLVMRLEKLTCEVSTSLYSRRVVLMNLVAKCS